MQLAHLVAALHRFDLAQVALGDAPGHGQGLAQRLGDLQGDQPAGHDAYDQRQQGYSGQQRAGLKGFPVALLDLAFAKFQAYRAQLVAHVLHVVLQLFDTHRSPTILIQAGAVLGQLLAGLLGERMGQAKWSKASEQLRKAAATPAFRSASAGVHPRCYVVARCSACC
ncbi:hypothetical protein D3C81_753600 [compost metagenome]